MVLESFAEKEKRLFYRLLPRMLEYLRPDYLPVLTPKRKAAAIKLIRVLDKRGEWKDYGGYHKEYSAEEAKDFHANRGKKLVKRLGW